MMEGSGGGRGGEGMEKGVPQIDEDGDRISLGVTGGGIEC